MSVSGPGGGVVEDYLCSTGPSTACRVVNGGVPVDTMDPGDRERIKPLS